MDFHQFEKAAREVLASIPAEFLEGVDGLEISRATVPHPTLPDIYTLGECLTESYPSEFGGAGEVRSTVALYYGSFLALSRLDDDWDWEEEIYVTVTHEVQHHRESMALDESLEELDYADDQNFARREGHPFDPFFYRAGPTVAPGVWEVDGDRFVEVRVGRGELAAGWVEVEWEGARHRVAVTELGKVRFETLAEEPDGAQTVAVLLRRGGPGEWIAALRERWAASNLRSLAPRAGTDSRRDGEL
jgi:predicted Zn-dependent protease with MMP-like domain